jgi:hypothetical protein
VSPAQRRLLNELDRAERVSPRGAQWRTADCLVGMGLAAWQRGEKWRPLEITAKGRQTLRAERERWSR